jgi:hypothetical protein
MLEKDPENRYPSGEALCEDLAGILQERGESAAVRTVMVPATATLPPGTKAPSYRRRRRGPVSPMAWVFASVAGILILAVALSVGGGDGQSAGAVPPTGNGRGPLTNVLGTGAPPKPTLTLKLQSPNTRATVAIATGDTTVPVTMDSATGTWATDTLRPGTYRVSASVPGGRPNCPTATVSKQITITAAQIMIGETPSGLAELYPRNCVNLSINTRYNGGRPGRVTYTLSGLDFNRTREVAASNQIREVVPIGQVNVLIRPQYCAEYRAGHTVVRDTAITRIFICGPGS